MPARIRIIADFLDAQLHGDGVSRLEANAADIARQPIRVLRHHLHGIGAIGFEDAHRPRCAHAMAVKEDHDFAHDLLFGPGSRDTAGSHWTNALDLTQALRLGLDNIEYFVAENAHQLLGVDRTDAADHAGGEIFLDAVDRARCRCAEEAGLELLSVNAVIHPFARCGDPFASGNCCGVSDHRHEIAVPPGLRPQDAEPILRIVERHALDEPRQHLLGR